MMVQFRPMRRMMNDVPRRENEKLRNVKACMDQWEQIEGIIGIKAICGLFSKSVEVNATNPVLQADINLCWGGCQYLSVFVAWPKRPMKAAKALVAAA